MTQVLPSRHARWLLVAVVLVAIGLRSVGLGQKNLLTNDEGWSYLAAACNEDRYYRQVVVSKTAPFGVWTAGHEWKAFVTPSDTFCFGTIATGLAAWDVHPPLYFWLLHLAVLIFGVHMWTGPLVNMFVDVGSVFLLFGLARRLTGSTAFAGAVALIWAASPAVLAASWEARAYPLLVLVALGMLRTVLGVLDQRRLAASSVAALGLSSALGLLTHYYFALWISGCAVALWWVGGWSRRDAVKFGGALFAGGATFLALHPASLSTTAVSTVIPLHADLSARFLTVVDSLSGFVSLYGRLSLFERCAVCAVMVLPPLAMRALGTRALPRPATAGAGSIVLVVSMWTLAALLGTYLAGFAPAHAMGSKYLSLLWPFAALGLVGLWSRAFASTRVLAVPCLVVVLFGAEFASRGVRWGQGNDTILASADSAVIDSVHPGIMPRLSFYLSDEQQILAADQLYLLSHMPLIHGRRSNAGAVFLATRSYSNTIEAERDSVARASAVEPVLDTGHSLNGTGRVYRIGPVAGAR